MSIEEKILGYIYINKFDVNYIYQNLKQNEQLSDDDIALYIIEIINNNLKNNNTIIILNKLLKIIMINNNLCYRTKMQIKNKLNLILEKECHQDIFLLLDNLRSYIDCLCKQDSNEQQLRNFYEEQLKQNEREINNLHKLINKKDKKIKDLEKNAKDNNQKLNEKQKKLQEKEKLLNKLKKQMNDEVIPLAQLNKLKDYFLNYLEDAKTMDELIMLAKEFNLNDEEFKKIMEMLKEYNITSNIISFPKYYQITPIKPNKKETFYLPLTNNEIDMLMIADLHIRNISNYSKYLMYCLNNYAIKNNISLAIILGDVFDIHWEDLEKNKYNFIKNWEKIAFQVKREFDISPLNYIILGGNHDERSLFAGIDLLKYLENNCQNVKEVGYQDASIILGDVKKNDNNIGIHHTSKQIVLPKPVYIGEYENRKILSYLNNQFNEKTYFDFFGHFHFNYLNVNDGYALINNFSNTTTPIKAYHLKFYLNERGNINNMVIKPLSIYYDELLANNEINYKKIRKI